MLATHSRGIPSPRRSLPQPLIPLPTILHPPRFKVHHRRSTNSTTIAQMQTPAVNGLARGEPARWTLRRGYFLGRLTTPGSALPRHAKNAVPARPRSVVLSPTVIIVNFLTRGSTYIQCSGEHPTCQRCQARGLPCSYASERRMRGPNKPKLPPPPHPDGSQPAAAEAQKTRKRAFTMPSAPRRGSLVWGQQKNGQNQQRRQQQGVASATAASPASPASSAGSESLGYPPLSESEASPMTPHSSLDSRRPSGAGLPVSPRLLFTATMPPGVLSHVGGSNGYEDDGALAAEGIVSGEYGRDIPPDVRMSFESTKTLF